MHAYIYGTLLMKRRKNVINLKIDYENFLPPFKSSEENYRENGTISVLFFNSKNIIAYAKKTICLQVTG